MTTMLTIPTLIQINALYPAYTYQHKLLINNDYRSSLALAMSMAKALEALGLDLTGQEPPRGPGGDVACGAIMYGSSWNYPGEGVK
jgi:hypothetical protein